MQFVSKAPEIKTIRRTFTVEPSVARAYGLTAGQNEATDTWIEQGFERLGWVVAGRLVPDDQGSPVIAELKIFPFESNRPIELDGSWGAAEVLGVRAKGVPRGGVSPTFLRHTVSALVKKFERTAAQSLSTAGSVGRAKIIEGGVLRPFNPALTEFASALSGLGFDLSKPIFPAPKPPATKRRSGRPSLPQISYARLAVIYQKAREGGRHPINEIVASGLAKSRSGAKSMVKRARTLGFLTAAGDRGRTYGEATPAARQLIENETAEAQPPQQSALQRAKRKTSRKPTDRKAVRRGTTRKK